MKIVTVDNSTISKTYRRIKALIQGFNSHDSLQIAPWGDDSVPIKGTKAVKSETGTESEHVVLGYFNKNQKAKAGEKRIFATDSDGNVVGEIYLTNKGYLELLGTGNWLVKFNEMKTAFDALVTTFNAHTHTETGAVTTPPLTSSTASMDGAKTTRIKTV